MGYGIWAIGARAPMGPMDAEDGCPTQACPECGANANPFDGDEDAYRKRLVAEFAASLIPTRRID